MYIVPRRAHAHFTQEGRRRLARPGPHRARGYVFRRADPLWKDAERRAGRCAREPESNARPENPCAARNQTSRQTFHSLFQKKVSTSVATKDEANGPKIGGKKRGIFGERIPAPGENRTAQLTDIFEPRELGKHPRGFVASLFRVFRFSALDVHSHVEILTCMTHDMRTADAHIRHRSRENLRELRERLTRRADRTRGHLAARDARPRDARARGLESRGLGGGGVSEMHGARYGSAPPSAAATTRRAPKRRLFMASRVESFTRAPDKTRPSDRLRPRPPQE